MSFDFLTILVIVNALVMFVLWSERRPEKIKKKFRKQLYDTKPITPKHRPPKVIGGQFESLVRENDRAFFADFADFANVVNWWLADEHVRSRWRLQELPQTELRLHGVFDYGPTFGWRAAFAITRASRRARTRPIPSGSNGGPNGGAIQRPALKAVGLAYPL
jgi:hypothetical protein